MRIITHVASYLVPVREQFFPPTSIQLLITNKTSDDNLPAMSVDCLGTQYIKFDEGARISKTDDCTAGICISRSEK